MHRKLLWLVVAMSLLAAVAYLFNSQWTDGSSAWILWEKNMTRKSGNTTTAWEPLDGFARFSDCEQSGREIIQGARDFMSSDGRTLVAVRPDGRSAAYSVTEDGAQHTVDYRLLCFPGPFDPRSRP